MLRRLLSLRARAGTESPPADARSKAVVNDTEAHELRTLGNKCLALGNLPDAENCFRRALAFKPDDTHTLTCLGYTLKERGNYAEAFTHLRHAVAILGKVPEAHEPTYLIGQIAELQGDLRSAELHYLEVLTLKPDFALACADLCRIYPLMGMDSKIPGLLQQCTTTCPHRVDYCSWYGNLLLESKDYKNAMGEFERLIQLQPGSVEAHNNHGICLVELGRSDEAIHSFTMALQLHPGLAQVHSNRGAALMRQNAFAAAAVDFGESIRLSPDSAVPHNNFGEAMREMRQLDAAIAHYEIAMQLEPNDPVAYWNKALVLLLKGEMVEGFSLFEHRFGESFQNPQRDFTQALWLGNASLQGKTILIHSEYGLGDTIQFCRYVPLVAAWGASVILEVQKPLVQLLQDLPGIVQLVARGDPLPAFDCHCPLLSLPHALRSDEGSIPRSERYLSVDAERRQRWSQILGPKTRPLVGIVWSGNASHKNDHNRSSALSNFAENLPACCRYVSLQTEYRESDRTTLRNSPWIEDFSEALTDFRDTAALCDLMDVVVSVDTSVAHLAAALGKPVWVLLSYSVDWRWMLDRADSPWYPSMRLYRQENLGNWSGVLQNVARDLRLLAGERQPPLA